MGDPHPAPSEGDTELGEGSGGAASLKRRLLDRAVGGAQEGELRPFSDAAVRKRFIKKVYAILTAQESNEEN